MDRKLKKLLRTQKNIVTALEKNTEYTDRFFAKAYYQIKELIIELNSFLVAYTFDDLRKEQAFFKNQMTNLYADYWYCSELYHLHIQKPIWTEFFQQFFIDSSKKYKNYKTKYADEYAKYCSDAYKQENQIYLKAKWITPKSVHIPSFMDSEHKELFPSYMQALERLLNFFKQMINSTATIPFSNSMLTWNKSKSDLVILGLALKHSDAFGKDSVSTQRIVGSLSKFFNIEINNLQKVITDIKNRKNPENNILLNMTTNFNEYINK